MAQNKSSKNIPLLAHVLIYGVFFLWVGLAYAAATAGIHFIVDYFSSRAMKRFLAKGDRRKFFVALGLDQLTHYFCLILLYQGMFE